MIKLKLAAIVAGLIGAYSSAAWCYIFARVIQDGEFLFFERVGWILLSELVVSGVFSLVCLGIVVAVAWRRP